MNIFILGICGTFMGSLALLARALGFRVSGCDENAYPPMSEQLRKQEITVFEGYDPAQLEASIDLVVIGNALSRANPMVEAVLDRGLNYTSGAQFIAEHILHKSWVLAVTGTHGKTTTAAMLSLILDRAGLAPGFLIGGVPKDFETSARLGKTPFFVIEGDEYDTAFFDKRAKFVHYRPRTLVINNLEFDHADIYADIAALQRQFHHLLRTVPRMGKIFLPRSKILDQVMDMGLWSSVENLSSSKAPKGWGVVAESPDQSAFRVYFDAQVVGRVRWSLRGKHNMMNALAAIAAARHVGVTIRQSCAVLADFTGVKRRMDFVGAFGGVSVFDDFAHHPTAIATTLAASKAGNPDGRIFAVIEPRSNTMKEGHHQSLLATACQDASKVLWYEPEDIKWSLQALGAESCVPMSYHKGIESIIAELVQESQAGDQIIIMSNGAFEGIQQKLLDALHEQHGK